MRAIYIFRGVVAMMSAIATGIGITLDTLQITQMNFKWWIIIAFGVSCVFVIWIIADLSSQNKELESRKPTIVVTPVCVEDSWYLEVFNAGEKGIFTAQLYEFPEVKPDAGYTPMASRYDALWASTNTNKTEIMSGHSDMIVLAKIQHTPTKQYFLIKAYDVVGKSPYNFRHVEYKGFRDLLYRPIIGAIISSDPSPRGGAFFREYRIELDDITELPSKRRWSIPDNYTSGEYENNEVNDEL